MLVKRQAINWEKQNYTKRNPLESVLANLIHII